jgi:hypothetical protein
MTVYPIDQRSSNGNLLKQGDQFIKGNDSVDPDLDDAGNKNYGQNGYGGASSDLPGERTASGFLPDCKLPADYRREDWQNRKVDAKPYPLAHGMKTPGAVKMSTAVSHPVKR